MASRLKGLWDENARLKRLLDTAMIDPAALKALLEDVGIKSQWPAQIGKTQTWSLAHGG
jgi:hypothetical protein